MKQTQIDWVRQTLSSGHRITPYDAYVSRGIMRLGAIIYDLRKEGVDIATEIIAVPNRYGETCHVAEYRLSNIRLKRA